MILERRDIDPKYKWDLTKIYKDEDAFNADYKKCEDMIKEYAKHEAKMLDSAEALYEALRDMTDIEYIIDLLYTYSSLGFEVDTANNSSQALEARVRNLAIAAGTAAWFVPTKLLKLDGETLDRWFAELPSLETFRRRIENERRYKDHMLSDDCELLMAKLQDAFGAGAQTRGLFANADLKFGNITDEAGNTVELTDTNYVPFLMSNDRRVREDAFTTLYKTYDQFGNTFASLYAGHIKERTTLAKARGFENSITSYTFGDEVTPEIYNNLISSVNAGLAPLYDYYRLKAEVLGVDKLHLYDVYAPLISSLDKKYTYEEAVEETLETVKVFGGEYYNTLKAGLTERGWVDVYPTRGKRGGAFSSGCPGTEPYILLNFNGTFDNVSTLAHEAGHSMHSYFSRKYNEPHNSNYTIFVAEVASTVNELLMAHRKLRECENDTEKLYILNELIETYKGTLYRQTMFAEFERDMHALSESGVPLTADVIKEKYYKLVKHYFGEDVEVDKQIECEWMRIPHFYSCFYVYKYATCISAASAIVKRIEEEGDAYVSKYIDFLKCGGSRSPLDSLLVAGIDMRDPGVVTGAIEDFSASVRMFREIYEKTK